MHNSPYLSEGLQGAFFTADGGIMAATTATPVLECPSQPSSLARSLPASASLPPPSLHLALTLSLLAPFGCLGSGTARTGWSPAPASSLSAQSTPRVGELVPPRGFLPAARRWTRPLSPFPRRRPRGMVQGYRR